MWVIDELICMQNLAAPRAVVLQISMTLPSRPHLRGCFDTVRRLRPRLPCYGKRRRRRSCPWAAPRPRTAVRSTRGDRPCVFLTPRNDARPWATGRKPASPCNSVTTWSGRGNAVPGNGIWSKGWTLDTRCSCRLLCVLCPLPHMVFHFYRHLGLPSLSLQFSTLTWVLRCSPRRIFAFTTFAFEQ